MGTSRHYRDQPTGELPDETPSLAIGHQHDPNQAEIDSLDVGHIPADHDLARILRDIRDILAAARADIAEILRHSRPPNDHA